MSTSNGPRRPVRVVALAGVAVLASVAAVALLVAVLTRSTGEPGATLPAPDASRPTASPSPGDTAAPTPSPADAAGMPRGYLANAAELEEIAARAEDGVEPHAEAVAELLSMAAQPWEFPLESVARCGSSASEPVFIDDGGGVPPLYARAIAYRLTGEERYAEEARDILERIMTEVEQIDVEDGQCQLNFGWGTPELVASADLLEGFWNDQECSGPTGTEHEVVEIGSGPCKELWGNWLVKNPYYIVSAPGMYSQSNWGAAATNAMAYIADYLWDRPELRLVHRAPAPAGESGWTEEELSPAAAFAQANTLAIDRMNGYRVELGSSNSCDTLDGDQQSPEWDPVKSQITEGGIIPEDARRDEFCNVPQYDGTYQNYPQIHLGNVIQQCELMLRRGDAACYDNVDETDQPEYTFVGPDGDERTTHLYPGRGSVERAINAIIVDSRTEWRRESALAVAYHYYRDHGRLGLVEAWEPFLGPGASCAQDLCFGNLTHGLAPGDPAPIPPTVAPPTD